MGQFGGPNLGLLPDCCPLILTNMNCGGYTSFMSGNTTFAGIHIGQSTLAVAEHSLSSDSVFCSRHLRLPSDFRLLR
jgi:hypothetical protein